MNRFIFSVGLILLILSANALAETPEEEAALIKSFEQRCLNGDATICGALRRRAELRQERCDACAVPADKNLCLEEVRCWGAIEDNFDYRQKICTEQPHSKNCDTPASELPGIKGLLALCQIYRVSCS